MFSKLLNQKSAPDTGNVLDSLTFYDDKSPDETKPSLSNITPPCPRSILELLSPPGKKQSPTTLSWIDRRPADLPYYYDFIKPLENPELRSSPILPSSPISIYAGTQLRAEESTGTKFYTPETVSLTGYVIATEVNDDNGRQCIETAIG